MSTLEFVRWLVRRLAVAGPALVLTLLVFPQPDHEPSAIFWIAAGIWAATAVTRRGGRLVAAAGAGLAAAWVVLALGLLTEGLRTLVTGRALAWHPSAAYALFVSGLIGVASFINAALLRRRAAAARGRGAGQRVNSRGHR